MSIVPKETIEVISQSIGITNLSLDVLPALAADVEYIIREIMQEAIKCTRHSRRTTLTTEDVDSARGLRNVEPIYGFASGDPLQFKRAAGHKNLFYIEEKDVEFKEVIEAPLPKAPLDTAVVAHWLAIEGVQPAIPENPPSEALQTFSMPSDNRNTEFKEEGVAVDIKLPMKRVLSRELQLYFEKISELTLSRSESPLFKQALVSLATDSGIHPLVPYFTFFVADEVSRNLNNFGLVFALMHLVWSLLRNQHIHIEPYLHQLMPSIMTCLVAKRLGNKFSDNHWNLRNFIANLVASICKRFAHVYYNLQPRVTRTLLHTFLDSSKSLPQHYGAIQGLAALGPKCAGLCIYDQLKMVPSLLAPPQRTILKSNYKVNTARSNKRKAIMDNTMHQPPLRKQVTESSLGTMAANPQPVDMAGIIGGYSTNMDTNMQPSRPLKNNSSTSGTSGRREMVVSGQGLKTSAAVDRAWRKDADAGYLLPKLYEYFGESMMLSFVPSLEGSYDPCKLSGCWPL